MNLHHKPIRYLAKAGYSSRGVVYLVIGVFALLAAIGSGENKSAKDALSTVLSQPFGTVMIVVLIAGLVGYVLWRLIQAIFDTDGHGRTLKGFTIRIGLLVGAGAEPLARVEQRTQRLLRQPERHVREERARERDERVRERG